MSILAIIIFLVFGVFSTDSAMVEPVTVQPTCASSTGACTDGSWILVTINGVDGVIVPASAADDFGYRDGWVPTVEQVTAAEDAIMADQGVLDHNRQYVGFTEDGQQKIYINGFCNGDDMDWQTSPVFVLDGGECFFGAVYNVDTGTLESFRFNGEA